MPRRLAVLANGVRLGRLTQRDTGALDFEYEATWRATPLAHPMSLSMPLVQVRHEGPAVRAFLEGLLPDDPDLRRQWGRRFGVSPNNPFSLLEHMGADCPGALQFLREEDVEATIEGVTDAVVWHSETEVAEILRALVEKRGVGRSPGSGAYFSLAGAQPKTALLLRKGRWGTPAGRIPTTHILKPPAARELPGIEVNEHFCLTLARHVGLRTVHSWVQAFEDQSAIVVERFDRGDAGGGFPLRLHQEDLCQALGVPPARKYENEGGPGVREILGLIRTGSDAPNEDTVQILRSLAFNWVIGGSDAHAKNFAILFLPGSEVTLAPLFDLISVLPYPAFVPESDVRLAMGIGREYELRKIGRKQWERLAEMCELGSAEVLELVRETVAAVPKATHLTLDELGQTGLTDPVLETLGRRIPERAEACAGLLQGRVVS